MVYTLHVDLDAFFASVEQRDNPELRNIPVAVVTGVRGPVAAASYEAKRKGIKSGMRISDAIDLCPNLTLVERSKEYYENESIKFLNICERYGQRVLAYGPDEAWIDTSDNVTSLDDAIDVAMKIKYDIKDEMGITSSAGISEDNKLLAKQGSDMYKPNGLAIILPPTGIESPSMDMLLQFYPLPVRDLYMVGESREAKLKELDVETIGDLASLPRELLTMYFKNFVGNLLFNYSHGIEDPPIEKFVYSRKDRKSISHMRTLDKNRRDYPFLESTIYLLSIQMRKDLQHLGVLADRFYTNVRYEDFSDDQRLGKFQHPTDKFGDIYQNSRNALKFLLKKEPQGKKVRALTIRATRFVLNDAQSNDISQLELMLN